MLESGIVALINANATVAGLCPQGGGFLSQAAKDLVTWAGVPTWSYSFGGGSTEHTLTGLRGPRQRRLRIECYGEPTSGGGDAVALSEAIDDVLDGFSGWLPDTSPPTTGVLSCLMEEEPFDYFDDAGRTYRRMTEYLICF